MTALATRWNISEIIWDIQNDLNTWADLSEVRQNLLDRIKKWYFTAKALRVLSGRLPFDDTIGVSQAIREIINGRKRNPDPNLVWNELENTKFIREDIIAICKKLPAESLIQLNNLIFERLIDGAHLWENGEKYRLVLSCIDSALQHKVYPGTKIEDGNAKVFYTPWIRVNNRDTTTTTRVWKKKIRSSLVHQSP